MGRPHCRKALRFGFARRLDGTGSKNGVRFTYSGSTGFRGGRWAGRTVAKRCVLASPIAWEVVAAVDALLLQVGADRGEVFVVEGFGE